MKLNNIVSSKMQKISKFFSSKQLMFKSDKYNLLEYVRYAAFLLPGIIFLSIALCLLFAPQYLALFFCAFLLAFGLAAIYIGYKVNQIRIKFSQISAQVEAKLIIDPESLYNINTAKSAFRKKATSVFEEQLKSGLKTDSNSSEVVKAINSKGDVVVELADGKKVICH